jgi:O-succinylbenzoic acid--CoA ligase
MEYPLKTIVLNGRRVSIQKIIDGKIEARTPFEKSTLTFIKSWLNGQEKFQLRTSGSTGTPKKIIIPRDQMISSAHLTIRKLRLKKGGTILLCIDPQFIGGMMMLVRAFV